MLAFVLALVFALMLASLVKTRLYSESRIELRNLQILQKMLEKSRQFLSSE